MAKSSAVQRDLKRRRLAKQFGGKREALKSIIMDKSIPLEDRFVAQLRLAELPRNGSRTRIRNRCAAIIASSACRASRSVNWPPRARSRAW